MNLNICNELEYTQHLISKPKKKNRLFNIMCHEITIQPLEKPLNTYALTGPSDP